jgi:hypothetical protein
LRCADATARSIPVFYQNKKAASLETARLYINEEYGDLINAAVPTLAS